ncbi:MFS transporter [Sphingomonas bacterium]|uniref:MFS transporter n=1 Tax=Sphingomonas bacterium TaxID=1895847 RepID=UPI001575DAE4|nr:MFS transporter [Sphingomonas bacterium]
MTSATAAAGTAPGLAWDSRYEWRAVLLLTLGFGLVGLDRWVIADLAGLRSSTMVSDLALRPQDVGNLVASLGIAWGVSSLFMGNLSDVFGRRRVIVPSLVLFSILSGFSGLAGTFLAMLLCRITMGLFEGAFCPSSFAAVAEASLPRRRGNNLGFQQSAFALFGLGFGPTIAALLLGSMSWRWVFAIVGIPGLIVAALAARIIREPASILARRQSQATGRAVAKPPRLSLAALTSHRNLPLSMAGQLCAMCGIFVLSAFTPAYLSGYLHLSDAATAGVTSAIGFGGFLGQWGLPAASDRFGRRAVAITGFVVSSGFLLLFTRLDAASGVTTLFATLFLASGFSFGLLSLISGPIASEAAPLGMVGGVIGVVAAVAEIFGGGVAPSLGGYIAQHYGIQHVLWLALAGLVAGIVVSLFFIETAPRLARIGEGERSALDATVS